MSKWESVVADLKDRAQEMHEAREAGLQKTRSLVQVSSRCIRHIHRHQFEEAEKLLAEAKRIAAEAQSALQPFQELYHAGYLNDSEKEMVEAAAVLAIVRNEELPGPDELHCGRTA